MFGRFALLLLFLLLPAAAAWGGLGVEAALPAAVLGALAWLAWDWGRFARLMAWLRAPDLGSPPRLGTPWGELADRFQRLLRGRDTKLAESESRLDAFLSALQASPNGVTLLEARGHIEWCNRTAAAHFGLDLRRDHFQMIGSLVRDPNFAAYFASHDYGHEVIVSGREGSTFAPQRLSVQLHPYGEGRLLLLSRDVTAVSQAEAMRRDFVANVSHEIRTPLTVLSGFIETLQSIELDAPERERYLALMAGQAERMQTLVNDLLTLSRLEGSPMPGFSEWVDLAGLMRQCEDEARGLAATLAPRGEGGHELQFDEAPPLQLAGTAAELRSAFSNLIANALRYTPPSGRVEVGWRSAADGRLEFFVADTGPGIAPEHIPRLTERFYRVDQSRSRESGGTGLGLAIVKHVIQRHGGELRIASTLGKGSRFSLLFPSNRVRDLPEPA